MATAGDTSKRRRVTARRKSRSSPTPIDELMEKYRRLAEAVPPAAEPPELHHERQEKRRAWLLGEEAQAAAEQPERHDESQEKRRDWFVSRGVGEKFVSVDLRAIPPHFPAGYHRVAARLASLIERPDIVGVVGPRGLGKTAL